MTNPIDLRLICHLLLLVHSDCLKLRSVQLNMYMTSSFDFCMRYLTRTSFAGCSSQSTGNRGQLIDITSLADLSSVQHTHSIIVLIPARRDILDHVIFHSPGVVGILIDEQTMNTTDQHFTEVSTCPEEYIGAMTTDKCSIRRNKYGIDFRGKRIDKPIFLLTNQTFVNELRTVMSSHNQRQRIHAHMKSYAYGAENAQICNRRSRLTYFGEAYFKHYSIKCRSPMINIVWSTFNAISMKNTRPARSVIVLYTKLDFFSIFRPTNAGAQSTGFSVITLLGLAWTLGRVNLSESLMSNKDQKDLLLLFVNGENWNYYGTFELTKLILEKQFPLPIDKSSNENSLHPIEAEHIDIVINIDQINLTSSKTYLVYDNTHQFLDQFKHVSSTPIDVQPTSNQLNSLADFRSLNVTTIAMITHAYEDMNPFYNSYQDTFVPTTDYSSIESLIYSLTKTICSYLNLPFCINDLSNEIKRSLADRIDALIDCFLRSDCSKIISETNETGTFHFQEVTDRMKENFSFLQPTLHQSEVKAYIDQHFLDASSYVHDILLNWIAVRTFETSESACNQPEEVVRSKFYQESTKTCLHVSINSINLIRRTEEAIDDRALFVSNSDQPELLIYMINDTKRDGIIFGCGLVLLLCGYLLTYFVQNLLTILSNEEQV